MLSGSITCVNRSRWAGKRTPGGVLCRHRERRCAGSSSCAPSTASMSMSSRHGKSSTRTGASAAPGGRRAPRSRTPPVFLRAAAPSSYPSMAARSRLPSATAAAARTPVLSPNPSAIPARAAASPMPMSRGAGEHRERQSLFIDLDHPLGDGMDVHVDARLAAYWAVRWFGWGLFKL